MTDAELLTTYDDAALAFGGDDHLAGLRAVERAARAAAFREAAELCERWADKWRPGVPVLADALRAHSEGER